MKNILISLVVFVFSLPLPTHAEGLLMYKPPQAGAPTTRTGGGTRGLNATELQIQVLAPTHTALTNQSQPELYWYLTQAKSHNIEITLVKEGVDQPLLEKQLAPISKAGLQSIRLAEFGVSLQPGEEYRWSVAAINDAEQRSEDTIASATIRYQSPVNPLASLEQQAAAGYWYDVLQQLLEAHSPTVNDLLKQISVSIPDL
jgi:hypothetical protein